MPGMLAYGNAAGNALNALQTGLQIGDEIKNGPADRQYILQQRQIDLANRQKAGQLQDYELRDKARSEAIQQGVQRFAKIGADIQSGVLSPDNPEDVQKYADALAHAGIPLSAGTPEFEQHLGTAMNTFAGNVPLNSKQALDSFNHLYAPQVNAAVGQPGESGTITEQQATRLVPSSTGGIHVELKNTTDDGKTYTAPATVGRDANPNAPVKDVNPEEAIQHTMGLAQVHEQIAQSPQLSAFAQRLMQLKPEERKAMMLDAVRRQSAAIQGQILPDQQVVKTEPGYYLVQDSSGKLTSVPVEDNKTLYAQAKEMVKAGDAPDVNSALERLKDKAFQVSTGTGKRDLFVDDKGGYHYLNQGDDVPSGWKPAKGGATAINAMSPDAVDDAAHTWIMTGAPPQGLGRSPLTLAAIANRKAEIERDKGDDASASASAQVANKATQHGLDVLEKQASVMGVAEKTATKNLDQIEKMAAKVDRTGSPLVNKLRNAWSLHVIQDPDLAALKNIVSETTTEYAKVMSGQTTGAGVSDAARAQTEKLLSVSDNPKAFAAEIATMRQAMRNRVDGTEQQRQEIMGRLKGKKPADDQGGAPLNPASATPLPDSQMPVSVKTPEEAQALPPGTHYVTPDGQHYTR